jgi:PAS domain S-box-containing protein
MRISIRAKILIFFAATLIITSVLNLFFMGQILRKDYKSALYSELLVIGDSLQTQLKRITSLGISARDIEGFNQQCQELVRQNNRITQAMIIDKQGTVIFHNDPSRQGGKLLQKEILSSITEGRKGIYSVEENKESVYFAVFPFGDVPDYFEYAVVITSPAKVINNRILSLINKCNVVLFFTFGIAAMLLLAGLTTVLTSPLAIILNTVKDIAKTRNLQKRVNIKGHDEIGEIADAFNKMTADLEHTTTSVDNLNREIAERKRIESELRESEKRFQEIANNAAEWIWEVDTKGLYNYSNPIVEDLLGYKPQEIVGKKYFYDMFTDKDRDEFKRTSLEVFAEKQSFKGFLNANVHKDGRIVWMMTSGVPILDDSGNLTGYRGSDIDITQQKKAEEAIKKSQKVLQDMIDAMPFGVVVIGKDKRIKRANITARHLTGYSENELIGSLCHQTLCSADVNSCPILDLNQVVDYSERKLVTKDGRQIPILKSVVQLRLGEEDLLLEAFIDITEHKEAEKKLKDLNEQLQSAVRKLEEANQDMKNFVYIASHDLREPLRKITAFGAILRQSLKDRVSGDDLENLQFMVDGAQRMTKMIEGLLVYSRVSTQAQPHQAVDLNEIVMQVQQFELAVLIEEKQVTIEAQSLPTVEADPAQIRQVMQNLIANGIKYQKKGNAPHITITSKPAPDGMARIEVTDNGIGIKPEYLGAIFIMFKRLHSRDEYEGTGIGLAVCKKIVERHGGKIGIESEPDKGSTFWFTIPAAEKTAVAAAEMKSSI